MTVPQPAVSELIDTRHPASDVKRFRSILFPNGQVLSEIDRQPQPECFVDLNLDQIVAVVTAGRDDYDLKPFYYLPSRAVTEISYRHDIFRDIEYSANARCLRTFATEMCKMRDEISQAQKLYYELQRQRCFLDSVDGYCRALRRFASGLGNANIRSEGLRAFRQHVEEFLSSPRFRKMEADAQRIAIRAVIRCFTLTFKLSRTTLN
jgi:DNA mismatch repair protein MutS